MDYRDEGYHARKPHSGGTSLRHRTAMNSPMVSTASFVKNGIRVVSSAIEFMCSTAPMEHTLRGSDSCGQRQIVFCNALDKEDWKEEEEMQGWGLGEDRLARLSAERGSVGRAMNSEQSH